MPSKKKKYNARFPAGRIKKIMQSDEEIGKVAQAVPVIISRTLELFVESLLNKTLKITNSRNAKTLSTSHMKQCIMSEQRFDFLRELVKNIPDISVAEEAAASYNEQYNSGYNEEELQQQSSPEDMYPDSDTPYDLSMPSTSTQATHRAAAASTTNGDYTRQHTTTPATHKYADNGGAANLSIPRTFIDEQSRAHLKRDTEIKQRLRQRITSSAAAAAAAAATIAKPSSVIMHTTSLVNAQTEDCLPPKLLRTDSAPATAAFNWHQHPHHKSPQQSHLQRQQRLKHQSHSVPNASNSCPPTRTPTNQQQMQEQQQHTLPPIPAPIVSIDFCNKPVVKIDYSNLSLPATLPLAPHSAPATNNRNASSSGFNFNAEPIINIDLSNIVGASSAAGAATGPAIAGGAASAASIHKHPAAVATISIGNIAAAALPATMAKTLVAVPTNATNNNNNSSDKAAPNTSAPKKDSFFELDEDYDNI